MSNWESWKMFKSLNHQERCCSLGFCSEDSTKLWEKFLFYKKPIFFLSLTASVVLLCKFTVEIERSSMRGDFCNSTDFRWHWKLARKTAILPSRLFGKHLTAVQNWFWSLTALLHSVQWSHLVFIRSKLLPAAEKFAGLVSILQCCLSCIHSPEWSTFFFLPWKNCLRLNQNSLISRIITFSKWNLEIKVFWH